MVRGLTDVLAAADPALMGVVVAVVGATGVVLAQWMARTDRGRLDQLERDVKAERRERRKCQEALRHLGVEPDEFDVDDE